MRSSSFGCSLMISASHSITSSPGRRTRQCERRSSKTSTDSTCSITCGRFSKFRQKPNNSSAGRLMVSEVSIFVPLPERTLGRLRREGIGSRTSEVESDMSNLVWRGFIKCLVNEKSSRLNGACRAMSSTRAFELNLPVSPITSSRVSSRVCPLVPRLLPRPVALPPR